MLRSRPVTSYLLACAFALLACWMLASTARADTLPASLQASGFDSARRVPFAPQFPLWSDGALKQRWLALPPGSFIDARQTDAWAFPAGTRLWKEFSVDGQRVETRFMHKAKDGRWRFASYVWDADGKQARLAPAAGMVVRGGRYTIPSRQDCLVCHGSAAVPVLGLTAVQLRGPGLDALQAAGWVRRLGPMRAEAYANPGERLALGYLHGNCAHCHNTSPNKAPLALTLAQRAADSQRARQEVLASLLDRPRFGQADGMPGQAIVVPGRPQDSLLLARMQSRQPATQMPPLGTELPDHPAIQLISQWIATLLSD